MSSLILYPINIESAPNFVIRKAFEKRFYPFHEYDWVNIAKDIGLHKTQLNFLDMLKEHRPDYCFMQLQNPDNMSVEMVREMAKYTKIINWTGDVRQTKEWYDWFEAIGREIFLTLFCNTTDVELMQSRGLTNTDYLQIGYDHIWYHPKPIDTGFRPEGVYDIVFCANEYGSFELSGLRLHVALAMRNHFGDQFKVFGQGWERHGFQTQSVNNLAESYLYRHAKVAISVSNFLHKRYHSDRLLRIMGCGCAPLSHRFPDMEMDFNSTDSDDKQNVVVFDSVEEAVLKAEALVENYNWRSTVGRNAAAHVMANCTWDKRMDSLIAAIEKAESKSIV